MMSPDDLLSDCALPCTNSLFSVTIALKRRKLVEMKVDLFSSTGKKVVFPIN